MSEHDISNLGYDLDQNPEKDDHVSNARYLRLKDDLVTILAAAREDKTLQLLLEDASGSAPDNIDTTTRHDNDVILEVDTSAFNLEPACATAIKRLGIVGVSADQLAQALIRHFYEPKEG